MLKIHHFFFINFAALFIGTLFVVSIVSYFSLKSLIISQTTERLSEEIALIALNDLERANLDTLALSIYKATQSRTTFISEAGTVLAESSADKYEMENHADRYE
ncbi:MAG TPA: sensor histidine kinase, partial [Helicobacteraceae bacterium]|nr:sensor histidine kinase [Helicobacteraceae bacterium]